MPSLRLPRFALPRFRFPRFRMPSLAGTPIARDDTMLGVCHAIGEDFGFNPNILRLALPILLFVAPVATVVGYLTAAVLITATRLIVREPFVAAASEAPGADADNDAEELRIAA